MLSVARRLEGAGLAIIAAASLSACFSSRTPLVPASESAKLFGDAGAAMRVDFGPGSKPARVTFAWSGGSYTLTDPREPRSRALYRISPMRDGWLLVQRQEQDIAVYGLARREGVRLWTYSPACQDLADPVRDELSLAIEPNGMCWLTSAQQLKTAMRAYTAHPPPPDGYFELIPPR